MRHLVSGSLGRRVSWAAICALLMPLFVLATPPKMAHAQLQRLPAVAVLDFGVLPGTKTSAILGRNATDAVVVEMARTGRYDVIPRTQLNTQLGELGLGTSLNNNGIQKLGQALGVDFVASGDITNISFSDNPRRAKVTVSVRFTDVITGELANGAVASGFSSPAPAGIQPDDETLISQALTDAAFNAIKTISNYTLPEATVLQTRDVTEVTLNRGGRDGLTPGTEMIVVRGRERVGRIKVTQVGSNDAVAAVLDYGKGIRPEDRARAIYTVPGYSVTADGLIQSSVPTGIDNYQPRQKHGRPILQTILGIAAAIFIASLILDSKSRTTTANGISSVTARAYAEGSVTAGTPDPSAARVQITWRPAADVPVNNVIEYHIFRDDNIIGVANRNISSFTDIPGVSQLGNTLTYTTITYNGNPGSGLPGNGGATTGTTGTTGTTSTTSTSGTTSGSTSGTNSTGQSVGTLTTLTVTVPAMTVGVTHRYRVSAIYQQVTTTTLTSGTTGTGGGTTAGGVGGSTSGGTSGTTSGGTNNNTSVKYTETNITSGSAGATPVARPVTTGPITDQNLQKVRVNLTTTVGANQYIVEFARDPGFGKKVTRGPFYATGTASTATITDYYDISNDFKDVAAGGRIYFRVGGRNSNDSPGPVALNTPNGGSYIYSANDQSFAKVATPPGTP